jgi:DNA-3-methyladenine glycosylase I
MNYHDTEWGRPIVDDLQLFEKVCLEGFQSGLSWITILRKREKFRELFCHFNPDEVAQFGKREVEALVLDPGIIRHRGKIEATIHNAQRYLEMRGAGETLRDVVWQYAGFCTNPTVACFIERLEKKGLEICRTHHHVRLYAVNGAGE